MQLTNILRDIKEDLERDRIYLPQNELARFGVTEADLASDRVTEPFRDLMRFQIDRARSAYQEAESGIPDILGRTNRLTVRVMGKLYGGILNAIERQDYDVFTARARVSMPRKLVGLSQCLGRELLGS
jgi:phytoene synthase